ncbi:hypothetical protein TESG_00548 [Trichophyton tonsurans CBS 112818]|uniref:Uncharacterized protein n=1 Tax=Trichophyton tonsurans (strain CBS 112818) TaxID=647933 RepID=F2RNT2_TRIT1|nr:hypothetical protein TESG_00548 [Trichophyton tonsurans CBS 112818]
MPRQFFNLKRRDKRLARFKTRDLTKKAKADRERFRRGKLSLFARGHELYRDRLLSGRDIYIYICIFDKKGDGPGKYSVYKSCSKTASGAPWPPTEETVERRSIFPLQTTLLREISTMEKNTYMKIGREERDNLKPHRTLTRFPRRLY